MTVLKTNEFNFLPLSVQSLTKAALNRTKRLSLFPQK